MSLSLPDHLLRIQQIGSKRLYDWLVALIAFQKSAHMHSLLTDLHAIHSLQPHASLQGYGSKKYLKHPGLISSK